MAPETPSVLYFLIPIRDQRPQPKPKLPIKRGCNIVPSGSRPACPLAWLLSAAARSNRMPRQNSHADCAASSAGAIKAPGSAPAPLSSAPPRNSASGFPIGTVASSVMAWKGSLSSPYHSSFQIVVAAAVVVVFA